MIKETQGITKTPGGGGGAIDLREGLIEGTHTP